MRLMSALSEQHELDEAIAIEKAVIKHLARDKPATFNVIPMVNYAKHKYIKNPGKIISTKNGTRYSSHADIDVLWKERKELDTFTNLRNPAYRLLRNVRNLGEYQYMDSAAGFKPAKSNRPGNKIKTFQDYKNEFYKGIKSPVEINVKGEKDIVTLDR